jgi:hypothetical protein
LAAIAVTILTGLVAPAPGASKKDSKKEARSGEDRFWDQVAKHDPPAKMGLRGLFADMLAEARSGKHPERFERLCDIAALAQNHDPKSPTYGNIKWTWRDKGVTDQNAIDFCMQDGALLWLKHRNAVPPQAQTKLRNLIVLGIEGCLRHRVTFSYTNITILNAANLIVLGEMFERPEVTDEGLRRLEGLCMWTWAYGTHEYDSPTYYGVDLNGLQFIQAHAKSERARRTAIGLLEVFWTDVALNWFPGAEKLGGAHSRSYDYLRGLGDLDHNVALSGLAASLPASPADRDRLEGKLWLPPADVHKMVRERLPRQVCQAWGIRQSESRIQVMHADVSLSTAGALYGSQDVPLAVNLSGDRKLTNGYFIADAREDPYGVKKYETSSARHMKALHLAPFWTAAQRGDDALGLVVYRKKDLNDKDAAKEIVNLQSHFVFRRGFDELWIGGRRARIPSGTSQRPGRTDIQPGDAVVLRYGTAAIGLRYIWGRTEDGAPAPAALIDDGNTLGALRLTIEHRSGDKVGGAKKSEAAAALSVRIGSRLAGNDDFTGWRNDFENARPAAAKTEEGHLRFEVAGPDGPVAVEAAAPYGLGGAVVLEPPPYRGVLALDGHELGRPILERLDFARPYQGQRKPFEPIPVAPHGGTYWEAESGVIFPGLVVAEDAAASAGHYVYQPVDETLPHHSGNINWPLKIEQPGRYYLWGRVLAPNAKSNSFFVAVINDGVKGPMRSLWDLPVAAQWHWRPLMLDKAKTATALDLPAGIVNVQLQVRETGTKIDRLFLTADAKEKPQD